MLHFTGKIIWFCSSKGFGFIAREGGPDIFFHAGAIEKGLEHFIADGEQVVFDIDPAQPTQAFAVVPFSRYAVQAA